MVNFVAVSRSEVSCTECVSLLVELLSEFKI